MEKKILGIHHVTAIAGDPQRNLDFYAKILGLCLVKRTVNFDDPGTYHLYYGDEKGSPGTILTFFPWPGVPRGRRGTGQVTVSSFSIPENAMGYWMKRFKSHDINAYDPTDRFEEKVLVFTDPDGLQLELVSHSSENLRESWGEGSIPSEFAIRGFHSVTLSEEGYEKTASLLTETMGFRLLREEGNRFRYATGDGEGRSLVDVLCLPYTERGLVSVGTVHHVAWRTPTDEEQKFWRKEIASLGFNVTPIINRHYFKSIYFREPGGVLFEIATDPPGFSIDEPMEELGTHLKLPPWFESRREEIERALPPLHL